tara:strand:+ start:8656 stop:9450 length:795 start_codon:yes stop_codon:yes gene_type:complete
MGIEDINQAAGAMNALTARINSFMSDADAEIAQRQGVYDFMVNDLGNEVNRRMTYAGTIDPDIAEPTRRDGGTFNTIGDAVDLAPSGALVILYLASEKTHNMNRNVSISNKDIIIARTNDLARPQVKMVAYADDSHNAFHTFAGCDNGSLQFRYCDINLPLDKINEALPWNGSSSVLLRYNIARTSVLSLYESNVTGANDHGLMTCNGAATNILNMYKTVLDGQIIAMKSVQSGAAIISKQVTTLSNGALITAAADNLSSLLSN